MLFSVADVEQVPRGHIFVVKATADRRAVPERQRAATTTGR